MIIKNVLWDFLGKAGGQVISFGVSIVLARLLSPADFGLIGIVMAFVGIAQVYLDLGFGAALIQRTEVSQQLFSTVFWTNICLGLIISIGLFFSSSYIATFYENPLLEPIAQALSLIFIIGSLTMVQNINLTRQLNFKLQSILSVISSLISGILGVIMALNNYGAWALVWQTISQRALNTILLWIYGNWRPSFYFNFDELKSIWGFSSKRLLTTMIASGFDKLDILMIGKIFSPTTLGFYSRAKTLEMMVNQYSSASITKVIFPSISKIQHDKVLVADLYDKAVKLTTLLSFLIAGFLFLNSEEIFTIMFGEKWLVSAKYFKIIVLVGFVYPSSAVMINTLVGLGFVGKNLQLGIIKRILLLIPLAMGYYYGINTFLYGYLGLMLVSQVLNIAYLRSVLEFKAMQQILLFIKMYAIVLSIIFCIQLIPLNEIHLFLSVIIKGGLYVLGFVTAIYLVERDTFQLTVSKFQSILKK